MRLFRPLYWLTGKIFGLWARPAILPEQPADWLKDSAAEVCYVLETGGLADVLALERACRQAGMPAPRESFSFCGQREARRIVVLRPQTGFWVRRPAGHGSARLERLVAATADTEQELLLIPIAIYWGRSPDKERSLFKLLFSENWELIGRTRKFFVTLLHGRDTLLRFSEPLPIRSVCSGDIQQPVAFRKLSRILRVHFRKIRTATVGPDLSHRRTLVDQVLRAPAVRRIIETEGAGSFREQEVVRHKARRYALEIAADISHPMIRVMVRLLRWLWHRIYDGVEVNHMQTLHDLANDKVIIYVPCHRSHFDYLLLGYVTYEDGLHLPHIAAGINLNLPIVGGILRRGGAFFLRRSFRGNRLYAAVFEAYIQQVLGKGHSMEYFIEGGRSRTGRLLQPKGGMLAMTVNSHINNPSRPPVFVPVYFGYEKLIEGDAFISELGGAEKKKESLGGLIRSVRSLRDHFGKVAVNIGEPIDLESLLDRNLPDWAEQQSEPGERPPWLTGVVDELGSQIMENINSAAAVTPISLLAYVLLATPKQTIGLAELRRQLDLSIKMLNTFRYSDRVTLPSLSADEIIAHGERLDVIQRSAHPMGEVVHMPERTAVLMTYFRNNIMHLLAVPAAVACCFIQGRRLTQEELQRLLRLIYPFMRVELFLKWPDDQVDTVTAEAIDALVRCDLLSRDGQDENLLVRPGAGSEKAFQLLMLGQSMVPMLQRFYLAIAILVRNGSGTLSRQRLESMCEKSAERLSMIYGLHSPDFFNKNLFRDFIRTLQNFDVLRRNADGLIEFDDDLTDIGVDARLVLGEEIRHSILSLAIDEEEPAES